MCRARSRPTCTSPGRARIRTCRAIVDIKSGAFGVPPAASPTRGLNTRIDLEPDKVHLQKFAILDEEGQPLNVSGELAVHARQVGAVNIAIDSDNFEVIDNELGDVGVDSRPHGHRRAAPAADSRHHPARRGPARGRPDPAAVLRPVFDGGAAGGRLRRAHGRERRAARRKRPPPRCSGRKPRPTVPGTTAQAEAGTAPAPSGAFAPVELDLRLHDSGQPRAARQGGCGRAARPARRSAT